MNSTTFLGRALLIVTVIATAAAAGEASAQASRTWVSGVGDDANPCSRTAPCKTFAGAIAKTAAKGEINVLDPGGYGAVTITKSITIDGNGSVASILAGGTNGVVISAGPADVVILRNLSINGAGTGINAIRFLAGGALHVENVTAFGFSGTGGITGNGIDFNPSGASSLHVMNSTFRNNAGIGVLIRPTGGGTAIATLRGVQMEENGAGLFQSDGAATSVHDSASLGNTGAGYQVQATSGVSSLLVNASVSAGNGTFGMRTDGASATLRVSHSTIAQNSIGFSSNGGSIVSFQNNVVAGNPGGDGVPAATAAMR